MVGVEEASELVIGAYVNDGCRYSVKQVGKYGYIRRRKKRRKRHKSHPLMVGSEKIEKTQNPKKGRYVRSGGFAINPMTLSQLCLMGL